MTTKSLDAPTPGPSTETPSFSLSQADLQEKVARLRDRLDQESKNRPDAFDSWTTVSRAIVSRAENGLQKLSQDGDKAILTEDELTAAEAIVHADGTRPSFAFQDGSLLTEGEDPGDWSLVVDNYRTQIEKTAASVGRINLNGAQKGSGFAFGDNLVLTNRHVLQVIAEPDGNGGWQFKGDVSIDFGSGQVPDTSRTFALQESEIVTSDQVIDPYKIDFDKLDYAVLRCKPDPGKTLPDPLVPETDAGYLIETRPVYAIGFPAKPKTGTYPFTLLVKLFNYVFGVKRFSPGEIDILPGADSRDNRDTVLGYDATTLPGSSGSPVIDVHESGSSVVGLHFAGWTEKANYAHAMAASQFRNELEDKGIDYPTAPGS
ncbi:serine protease [Aliisedimentitalea sp. MJ-SS2]|uniref:trypsin-like serine peptidase n=1 Tax=Aliisedimentitalea sp. MJ-SS2 TaxID=3049795 RepID=UPI002930A541|nr:serine protease [Alisedimentitalea sp. MJ-SS2]